MKKPTSLTLPKPFPLKRERLLVALFCLFQFPAFCLANSLNNDSIEITTAKISKSSETEASIKTKIHVVEGTAVKILNNSVSAEIVTIVPRQELKASHSSPQINKKQGSAIKIKTEKERSGTYKKAPDPPQSNFSNPYREDKSLSAGRTNVIVCTESRVFFTSKPLTPNILITERDLPEKGGERISYIDPAVRIFYFFGKHSVRPPTKS